MAAPIETSTATDSAGALPNRAALVGRLEAQRSELLCAMSCVDLARRTIAEHRAIPKAGAPPVDLEEHKVYRQRVLEVLSSAGEALSTAYPTLEHIVQALAVEEILKAHSPTQPPAHTARRSSASHR
jgi:hypothetical protein